MGEEKTHIYSFSIYASKVGFAKVLNVGFWELLNIGSLPGILEICRVEKNKNSISWNRFQQILDQTSNLNLGDVFFLCKSFTKIVHFEHYFSKLWTRSQTNEVWWGVSSSLSFTWKCYKMLILFFFEKSCMQQTWALKCKYTMQHLQKYHAGNLCFEFFVQLFIFFMALFLTWKNDIVI